MVDLFGKYSVCRQDISGVALFRPNFQRWAIMVRYVAFPPMHLG